VKKGRPGGKAALEKAAALYEAGAYESAASTLNAAVVEEDEYLQLAYLLGLCYARLGRHDEALLYLEQVVTGDAPVTQELQCRMVLAYIYARTGRARLAEYELTRVIDLSEESPQACAALGHAHWKQGRLDDGLRWYRRALELDPGNPTALNGYGYLLACADRNLESALTCCRKALESSPENPAYLDSLGWVCYKLGRLEEAGRHLSAAALRLGGDEECRAHLEAVRKAMPPR